MRQGQAWLLRQSGLEYDEIGRRLGVATGAAYKLCRDALYNSCKDSYKDERENERAALNTLRSPLFLRAFEEGDMTALAAWLKLTERYHRLMGLDAPLRVQHEAVDFSGLTEAELLAKRDELLARARDFDSRFGALGPGPDMSVVAEGVTVEPMGERDAGLPVFRPGEPSGEPVD